MPYRENKYVLFLQIQVIVLLVMSSILMTQQYILLNKHIIRLFLELVDENTVTRGLQELDPVFPLGAIVQCSLTHCSQRLYRT